MAVTATERLEFRVRPDVKRRIQEAADVLDLPVSEFALSVLEERAEQVLREHWSTTRVPAEFFDDLLDALDAPPRPNRQLAKAAKRARTLVTRE